MLRRATLLGTSVSLAIVLVSACDRGGTSISANQTTLPATTTTTPARGNVDGTLRLGALLPLTGEGAALGATLLAGTRLAIEQINAAGGIDGRLVELAIADEGSDPSVAAVSLSRLVGRDRVDAIVGPVSTRVTLSLLSSITSAGVLTCSPTNTASSLSSFPDNGYYVRTAPPDSLQAIALGQAIAGTGARAVALLYVDDDYGRGLADDLSDELGRRGTEVAVRRAIEPATTDLRDVLLGVLQEEPDVLAYAGVPDPGVRIVEGLRQLGVGPHALPVFVSDGMRNADLGALLGATGSDLLQGVRGTAMSANPSGSAAFQEALAAFDPTVMSAYGAYAYDCVNLLALAAAAAQNDDPAVLRSTVLAVSAGGVVCRDFATCSESLAEGKNIDLDGASGLLELGSSGDPEWGAFDIVQFDAGGGSTIERQVAARGTG